MTVTKPVSADLIAYLGVRTPVGGPAQLLYDEAIATAIDLVEGRIDIPITGRTVTNGVTNSTTTITSATAAFVASDVGVRVTGSAFLPTGVTIASVTNGTTALLSAAATGTGTAQTFTIAAYLQRVRMAVLMQASRLVKRRSSPEGVAGFGDLGVIRISGLDVDVERLLDRLVKVDGFY